MAPYRRHVIRFGRVSRHGGAGNDEKDADHRNIPSSDLTSDAHERSEWDYRASARIVRVFWT